MTPGAAIGDLFDRPSYPETPGFKESTTSRSAARKIAPRAPGLRDRVLSAILQAGSNGLTADEAAKQLGETAFAIRPRLTELGPRHMKKICKTKNGDKRPNDSGVDATVWVGATQENSQ